VNAAAFLNQDVQLGGSEFLTITAVVGTAASAATAAGDVVLTVAPYLDDATPAAPVGSVSPLPLPTLESAAAVLVASRAYVFARYRVAGINRVQIQVKNNNAAAKPVEANFDIV
jgi:hypothetical protein